MLFARVDIGVTDFPTKTAEKELYIYTSNFWARDFFSKVHWSCASCFQWEWGIFIIVLAAEKLTFWGGGVTSKLASQ